MKSLSAHPPWDWQYLQPETGMSQPLRGSFTRVVQDLLALRKANKYLADKHCWRTDLAGVEYDVEQQNVQRCLANGWTDFVQFDAVAPVPVEYDPSKKNVLGSVAGVKRVAAGVGVLIQWLGNGAKPVAAELAEKRASVCVTCPKNDGSDWKSYFTKPIAEKIRVQLEMRNDLLLRTSHDTKLTVCSGCDCPLQLKVHVPLKHILDHTSDEVRKRLDPGCWILSEEKQLKP